METSPWESHPQPSLVVVEARWDFLVDIEVNIVDDFLHFVEVFNSLLVAAHFDHVQIFLEADLLSLRFLDVEAWVEGVLFIQLFSTTVVLEPGSEEFQEFFLFKRLGKRSNIQILLFQKEHQHCKSHALSKSVPSNSQSSA